jgi:ribosomal-protein-alanine N-acetyltransferase
VEQNMTILLETPRLLLRELSLDDLDFIAAMLAHPDVMRFYPQLYSRQEAEAWIRRNLDRYEKHGHGFWLTVKKSSGAPVGQVGLLAQLIEGIDEKEIGYLLHRPFWKRGHATEAALAVRDHAFAVLGCPHVISLIRPINHPSQAVAGRLGMKPGKLTLHAGLEHIIFRVDRPAP